MNTFEETLAKVRANSSKAKGTPPSTLTWERVTTHKLVTACGRYCIVKCTAMVDGAEFASYDTWECAQKSDYGTLIGKKLESPEAAKAAASNHLAQGKLPL